MKVVLVLGTVSCLIGLSWAAVNATCQPSTCDNAKNEVCDEGCCKIRIEGACNVDQTSTSTATPPSSAVPTSASIGDTRKSSDMPITTETPAPTVTSARRKRRDATPAPMTNTQECVNNSQCKTAAGSKNLTCQCNDGYANDDDKGFCGKVPEKESSATGLRLEYFTYVMVTLFFYNSL